MDAWFFPGMLLGFVLAASPGPMWSLVAQRTLTRGLWYGVVTGLGDALGALGPLLLTFFGFLPLLGQFPPLRYLFGLVSFGLLLYIGASSLRASVPVTEVDKRPRTDGLAGALASAFTISALNPVALALISTLAGAQLATANGDWAAALSYFAGFSLGVFLWFFLLSLALSLLRRRLPDRALRAAARISGLLILGVALWSLVRLFTVTG